MKTNGYITITAAPNGYTCSADAGATQITFSPNAQGERAFECWVLDAMHALKHFRQVQRSTRLRGIQGFNVAPGGYATDDES